MVFQDPMTSLNPTMPIGRQISESVRQHQGLSRKAASTGPTRCSRWSACPGRPNVSATTRTSFPAACASAS